MLKKIKTVPMNYEFTAILYSVPDTVKCQCSLLLISTHVCDDARDEDLITNHKLLALMYGYDSVLTVRCDEKLRKKFI